MTRYAPTPACTTDLACFRNDGHTGDHAYADGRNPQPVVPMADRKRLAALLVAPDGLPEPIGRIRRRWWRLGWLSANACNVDALIAAGVGFPDARLREALDMERLYRVIADTAWDEASSPVGDPMDGIEQHDLRMLAEAIAREYAALGEEPTREGQG